MPQNFKGVAYRVIMSHRGQGKSVGLGVSMTGAQLDLAIATSGWNSPGSPALGAKGPNQTCTGTAVTLHSTLALTLLFQPQTLSPF